MKALLRIVLIVVGLALLVFSLWFLVWPWDKLVSSAQTRFGLVVPSAVQSPITVYMFRGMCVTYTWFGFIFLLAATNLPKYLLLIRTLALTLICLGLTCILVGVKVGLPIKPVLFCDGIPCLVAGILIWTLSVPLGREPAQAAPPSPSST